MSANRKQDILEVLARELESHPGSRITTARLAQAVGVSEAALYRHFPSKAKMFEGLIDFAEEAIFGLINQILESQSDPEVRCFQIGAVLLKFAERNPGIVRVLIGDALVGENERLRRRTSQIFARLETQINQILRAHELVEAEQKLRAEAPTFANLYLAVIGGQLARFVRSEFSSKPSEHWEQHWRFLAHAFVDRKR